ncbi:L-arabinose transport system permease protein AraQ [Phycisphaerales bacterium]|nr:L-arabinose transport system permease protein AraQ [Phycisphaerales bacterium]
MPNPAPSRAISSAVRYLLLTAVSFAFLMPLVWMVSTSIKPESQAASGRVALLPDPVSSAPSQAAENYAQVWNDPAVQFPIYLRNTLVVAALSVIGMTLSSAMVAYGLSRVRWKGRGLILTLVLATMMIPFPVIMAPLYIVFRSIDRAMEGAGILPAAESLRMIGSLKPLWIPAWFGGAFNIFLLRQFYMGLPKELDEAARLDGMSHWGIFWRIILPLSRPALAVVALFHFIYVWNDFIGPLIFLTHRDTFTLALGLQLYQGQAGMTPWNLLMAASTLVVAPVLVLFMITQRTLVEGISSSGLKD